MLLEEYKGYEIHVNQYGVFEARKDGEVEFHALKLSDLKKQIGETRTPAILREGRYYSDVEITSVTKGHFGYYAWVTKDKRRKSVKLGALIKPSEKNREVIAEVEALINETTEKVENLENQLERFSAKDFELEEVGRDRHGEMRH